MKLTPTIGLEVHMELSTNSKMFCGCSGDHFAKEPNTQTCPVCLGLPGALPFMNKKALEDTLKIGLAFDCRVNKFSKFDRKHYFYPDLPKSFQTSQYDLPFCENGEFSLSNGKKIKITRVHLEEDTGKLVHSKIKDKKVSLIDFNRSGVPLVEIVTEPGFESVEEVDEFLREIQLIVRYLEVSNADMEKGSMRLEANISLGKDGKLADYKVELKNINSFKFLGRAIKAEIERQQKAVEAKENLIQETRGYNQATGKTFSQRTKEEAKDYRYFPEPDLPPIEISKDLTDKIKKETSRLPSDFRKDLKEMFGLPDNYIKVLTSNKDWTVYFLKSAELGKKHNINPKKIAAAMVNLKLHEKFEEPALLVKKLYRKAQIKYVDGEETKKAVEKTLKGNKKAVKEYKDGRLQVIGFLIGQVQGVLKGRGDVKVVKEILERKLKK